MQPLKETKVYIPINSTEADYVICYNNSDLNKEDIIYNADAKEGYFLTKQEMKELLKDCFNTGFYLAKDETDDEHEKNEVINEYINKLLNNE